MSRPENARVLYGSFLQPWYRGEVPYAAERSYGPPGLIPGGFPFGCVAQRESAGPASREMTGSNPSTSTRRAIGRSGDALRRFDSSPDPGGKPFDSAARLTISTVALDVNMSFVLSYRITSISEHDGKFYVNGTCGCGYGANMPWMYALPDGTLIPRCNKCKRGSTAQDSFLPITREALDVFEVQLVMES